MYKVHINWSGCTDYNEARSRLRFLKVILWGNFADVETTDVEALCGQLVSRGFVVSRVPDMHGSAQIRLSR